MDIHRSPTMLATMRRYNHCQCQLSPYPHRPGTMVPLGAHGLVGCFQVRKNVPLKTVVDQLTQIVDHPGRWRGLHIYTSRHQLDPTSCVEATATVAEGTPASA